MAVLKNKFSGKSSINITLFSILVFLSLTSNNILSQTRNLDYYFDNAIKNNQTINENYKLISTYDIRKELVYANLKHPHIFGTANYLFAPTFGEYGYDSAITNGGLYSALINLEMPLFTGFTSETRIEDLRNEQSGFKNTILATRHEIYKNITDQYIKVFLDQEQINASNEILNLLDLQREVLRNLADKGIGKISDLNLLDIEYQTQILGKKQYEVAFETDLMDLNLMAGIKDSALTEIDKPDLKLSGQNSSKSYFLESFKLDSIKLATEKKMYETNFRPQLNFIFNTGLNAVTTDEIWKKFGFNLGLNFTFDIYNGSQVELNNRYIDIKQENIINQKNYFAYQNETRKNYLLKELKNQQALEIQMGKQLGNYLALLEIYRVQFLAGEVSLLDYINILKNYISFKNELIQNKNQQLQIINEYNYWNW